MNTHKPSTLEEKLLRFLSRAPSAEDYQEGREEWTMDDALSQLCRFFPNLLARIAGKEILDFGCGTGCQSVVLAQMGAKHVVGLDINEMYLEKARQRSRESGLTGQVSFTDRFEDRLRGRFDIVISQNSMEHFKNPTETLTEMKAALKEDGMILITFGCPWFSPYGSHMHFFVRVPWVNLLFREKAVMNVRRYFRKDGAARYEEVEGGLNKMSVAKFERLIRECGMRLEYKRYECVKGINFAAKVPLLRELLVNNISCIVAKV